LYPPPIGYFFVRREKCARETKALILIVNSAIAKIPFHFKKDGVDAENFRMNFTSKKGIFYVNLASNCMMKDM